MKPVVILFFAVITCVYGPVLAQSPIEKDGRVTITSGGQAYDFLPRFMVLFNSADPALALKPAGIAKVSYNVPTWKTTDTANADYVQQKVSEAVAGDGFDDKILRSKNENRTANIYRSGTSFFLTANKVIVTLDSTLLLFPENPLFVLKAWIKKTRSDIQIHFVLTPKEDGFYSVGYIGAPSLDKGQVAELWQPLIWTEKRAPQQPYMTPSFMATLPTTLVNDGHHSIGVMADPRHLPFQPLPLLENSQFGIALCNDAGKLQPQVFAPVMGGAGSHMNAGNRFSFSVSLIVKPLDITHTYEQLAKEKMGFRDYRTNATVSMNTTLDNLIDYSKTHYAWFIDSLKGFAYSTDVPGAVKNVSSLNPMELALIRDDKDMFETRAYPLMEFMLSREKFLFTLDSTQKIQSPSRKLKGPIAPLSELQVLYNLLGRTHSFYPLMAEKEFGGARVRNLDEKQKGRNWINAMFMFRLTSDSSYLKLSMELADQYLADRVEKKMEQFGDPMVSSNFFWPTFTNNWSALLELYELTGEKRYLDAAHDGARHYTLFTWMGPRIPDTLVTVNKGGKAPMYWYLKSKGHRQMYYPEEKVPAWRLSEMGLTSESSGTSTGHRGIFMSNYAPWLLRIGYYTQDSFLMNVAKAAVVGRSESFPGYHMNTERTTAYEKVNFPLHRHKDQSVNSFHYNHILPMASMFMDYLVTDAFVKSNGQIDFPSEYIEGYAYLQNKFYGAAKGLFFSLGEAQLWMPSRLLKTDDIALNYISAKKGDTLLLAFMNQSLKPVTTRVTVNPSRVALSKQAAVKLLSPLGQVQALKDSSFQLMVPASGIAAIAIPGADIPKGFQDQLLGAKAGSTTDYAVIAEGNAKALLFTMGTYARRLYVFLQDDDTKWNSAKLVYRINGASPKEMVKKEYPFEFTVPVEMDLPIRFHLQLTGKDGKQVQSKETELGR
ncbi:hypothetical protein U0035_05630 [Niabella yanshanensis]|uniref:Uncharacterized protein n=1 Tax=Niabella yanshanensis TaxID=577386 RepID=A0ABZ0WBV9_9BACT|nr:hypothetical protein [Niabella yanshanensis]WQD39626.1 hypothetical protein U0035_05630 [Niabella yanshanensis]